MSNQLTTDQIKELELFNQKLNQPPPQNELSKTPDGKAQTLSISFVEMKLDEIFLGQWSVENYKTKVVANEVVGECELWVINPITGLQIRRVGAGAIQIMVDKAPDNITGKARNEWALDLANKKPNALDLGYPKLKSECVKNAAISLGKIFGRDINRKLFDEYTPEYTPIIEANEGLSLIAERIKECKTVDELIPLWNSNPDLHHNQILKKAFGVQKSQILLKETQLQLK
jgi:hypothetical protein